MGEAVYSRPMRKFVSPFARVAVVVFAVIGLFAVASPADAAIDSVTLVSSPNTSPTATNRLNAVSCVSESWCIAVGYAAGTAFQPIAEIWNGTNWTMQSVPSPSPTLNSKFNGISCTSTTSCIAVGGAYSGGVWSTLVEKWDGSSWSIETSANSAPTESNVLNAVSCVSASFCVLVGHYVNSSYQTLIEVWDGSAAVMQTSANTSPSEDNILNGVSCLSATSCVAVGYHSNGSVAQTLSESWNGSVWSIDLSASVPSSTQQILNGVSCTSATSCFAVGLYFDGSVYLPLIEMWDGSSWSVQALPLVSANGGFTPAVSCVSATSCVVTGSTIDGGFVRSTLVATWDGSAWSVVTSPNGPGGGNNFVNGVSCASAWSCVGVGSFYDGNNDQTLVLSLSGPVPPTPTIPTTSSTTSSSSGSDPVVAAFTG